MTEHATVIVSRRADTTLEILGETEDVTMHDIAREGNEKLIRRHPHVFGDGHCDTAEEVLTQWDKIKEAERNGTV